MKKTIIFSILALTSLLITACSTKQQKVTVVRSKAEIMKTLNLYDDNRVVVTSFNGKRKIQAITHKDKALSYLLTVQGIGDSIYNAKDIEKLTLKFRAENEKSRPTYLVKMSDGATFLATNLTVFLCEKTGCLVPDVNNVYSLIGLENYDSKFLDGSLQRGHYCFNTDNDCVQPEMQILDGARSMSKSLLTDTPEISFAKGDAVINFSSIVKQAYSIHSKKIQGQH